MMLRLLCWLLWPAAALGRLATSLQNWADQKDRSAKALKPGARVALQCECHKGLVWYVEEYCVDAGDYKIVSTWPPPPQFGRKVDVDVMYIYANRLKAVS